MAQWLNRQSGKWTPYDFDGLQENWNRIEKKEAESYLKLQQTIDFIKGNINAAISTDEIKKLLADWLNQNEFKPKEAVATFNDLPKVAELKEIRGVIDENAIYVYDGKKWIKQSNLNFDGLSHFKDEVNEKIDKVEDNANKIDVRRAYQSLVSKKTNKPMITWIDDDGHVGVYDKLVPLLREYKIKMTSAIVTNFAHGFPLKGAVPHEPKFMSYEQMKEIENEGLLEYVCHTHTHNLQHKLTDMTEEELHEELSTNQRMIRELGWNHRHLVYPFGEFNDNVIKVVKQYFDSAFNTRGGTGAFNVGNIPEYPFNQFAISRVRCDAPSELEDIKKTIDKAVAEKKWIIIYTHVDQYGGLDIAKMRGVIEHAQAKGLEFVSVEEGINEYGNLAQLKDLTISPDGQIFSDKLGVVRYNPKLGDNNLSRDNFIDNKFEVKRIRGADAPDYKLPGAGILITFKSSESAYDFQKFIQTNGQAVDDLMRYTDRTTGEWSDWQYNHSYVRKGTELTPNSPLTNFPVNKVSLIKVNSTDASSYGLPGAGMVEVYRDQEAAYSFQRFNPHNTTKNGTYTRGYNTSWTDWRKEITARKFSRDLKGTLIPANATREYVTTSNLKTTDILLVQPSITPPEGLSYSARVNSDGNMVLRFINHTSSTIDLGSGWVVAAMEF